MTMSKCSKCGHECHCGADCEECVNDVAMNRTVMENFTKTLERTKKS